MVFYSLVQLIWRAFVFVTVKGMPNNIALVSLWQVAKTTAYT